MIPYIGPASKKQEMFLNSDADITLAGGAAGCFDKDTEYLSRTGWKKFNTYSGEEIAQFDPITKDIQFVTPLEYIKLPCDTLSRMSARGLDMCLSDEHRVPYWSTKEYSKLPNVISFGEVKNRHISSKTKGWTGNIGTVFKNSFEDADISDGEIRLQVAVQADGRVVKEGKDNYTQMRFGKERKYNRLISICKEYGLRYKDNGCKPCPKNSSGVEYEVIVWPSFPTKLFDDFWWTLSARQLKIVVEEVGHWDGTFVKNNNSVTIRYFTNKIQNADFIQYAFHSCGMNTSYVIDRDNVITVNATYSGKGFRCFANKDAKVNIENYKTLDGYKYCFSVPSTFLVVRRNNKIYISGNSGKTYTSLLIALKYMQHPRATGIIFRRTSVMLTSPGSIWHEAVSLYSQIYPSGLKIRERKLEIVFPNGALLKFSHMQHATDMYDHKGGQYSLVIFDEATDFTEDMVVYLLSRMRNAYVDYKPKMFMMTNPHYDSFLRLWIQDYYLDARGIPIQERTGNKRWFFRQGNTMLWYNSREEAVKVHGEGADNGVSSFTFIGATCHDNPPLLKAQPGYITNLLNQPRVEMERLLLGSWFARSEAAGHWKREWITEVDGPNPLAKQRVRAWDFAFTKPSETTPNPDYTRGVLISKDIHKVYTVEDVASMRDRVHEVEKLVFETAKRDGTGVVISIPKDPNAQAGAYARDLQRRLGERGYMVRLCPPVKSKLTRFAPFSSISQSGFVQVVKADWNKEYYEELEVFDGEGKSKDDQADATSDCITLLNREIILPNSMNLPNLTTNAPPTFNFNQGQSIISLPTFNI